MTALRDDERLFCAICGDEARYSRVGKTSVIVFGHIGRKRQDHPVRLAPASRSGDEANRAGSKGSPRRRSGTPERPFDSDRARRRGGGAVEPSDPGAPLTAPLDPPVQASSLASPRAAATPAPAGRRPR